MEKSSELLKTIPAAMAIALASNAWAQNVSVTDYEPVNSFWEELYLNGTLNSSKSRTDSQQAYDANLRLDYDNVSSTPRDDLRYRASLIGNLGRDGSAGAESESSYSLSAGVTTDNYFTSNNKGLFWYGSLDLEATDAFDQRQLAGIGGVGYGRVTNVTAMAKAIQVMDTLIERGQIKSFPSLAVYQQVAGVIDRQREYIARHGSRDYEQYWLGDIEKTLIDSGIIAQSLGAGDLLSVRDVLITQRISTRKVGWKVRAGLGLVYRSFDGGDDTDPALELGAEYHYPFSNRTQFSNEARLLTILDGEGSYTLQNVMSLTYELNDNIDWENAWILRTDSNGRTGNDVTVNTLSTAFYYSLTNLLDLSATLSVANVSGDSNASSPTGTDRSFFVGLRYRLR